jgi:23S rRNA pseudouridine1911/1915/1917 synthase
LKKQVIKVEEQFVKSRLDFLVSKVIASKRQANKLCKEGFVRVNGKIAVPGLLLELDDQVEVRFIDAESRLEQIDPEFLNKISCLYEDSSLICINKPALVHSVTLSNSSEFTCADWISLKFPECIESSKNKKEAGLVQRLDFSSSGAMLAARNSQTWESLHQKLISNEVEKKYLVLVEGELQEAKQVEISLLSGKTKMRLAKAGEEGALFAESLVEPIKTFKHGNSYLTLCRVSGRGMRRHQVRVHLSAIGHPLLGDELYESKTNCLQIDLKELGQVARSGFFLHSYLISFFHPEKKERLEIKANSSELRIDAYI